MRKRQRHLRLLPIVFALGTALGTALPSISAQAASCQYSLTNEWPGGFQGIVTITNDGNADLNGWQIGMKYPSGVAVTQSWSGALSGSNPYYIVNTEWNGTIKKGESLAVNFMGTRDNTSAANVELLGSTCSDGGTPPPPANHLPDAAADATPVSGIAPLEVNFSAGGSTDADGDELTYIWDFGDGSTGVGRDATHTYTDPGEYTAKLTVSDGTGVDTANVVINVTTEAGNTPPVADMTITPASGQAPLLVNFDASGSTDADNDVLTYIWDFGDGATGSGVKTSHTYENAGKYTVSLIVTDGIDTSKIVKSVTVSDEDSPSTVERVDNPFRGATWYVNPEWSAKAAAEPGGSAISDQNTGVWLDRIAAIEGTDTAMGLRAHLDEALRQGANLFTVVVYDLPNRDCRALASNGELLISEGGMVRYKNEFIDPIAEIFADPKYQSIRIAAVIEIDSLPNLVTNMDVPKCREAAGDDGYREGITYALNKFAPIKNVYSYIDAAHSGWLGWDSNFDPAINLISDMIKETDAGWDSVAGFVTNTANYTPTVERYLPDPYKNVGNGQVRSSSYYEWNPYFDEKTYAIEFRKRMIARGAPSTLGMLIDTGRNGWGGTDRPTHVSHASDKDTYVNESRIDRRYHRGNWCNQHGGIGYKPWADPYAGVDAFVWVKPPGESDGISEPNFEPDPDDPAKQYDGMCDPDKQSTDGPVPTGAMDNAPHAGRWFSAGFHVLLENAYPPVDRPAGPPEE
ncbi:glycoside hydrolase family 6 protein [Vibrio mangrovi]|uniref:Glucanase n=1 Tax=Vibrio mangrovi TaxID=474394 RepID=A0A1Y6IPQ5_9VIBR|nr:glycoside hydrolase family 6 protein [Vibrio mangrovi]MDW6003569.1 glycoside hydrolase family 6 protein [Vibrio mangrovi]SMR99639.1 Exoglucanase A precursor [Vibrio mangrovi]